MATTLSEAAAEVPAETTLFVQIKKMCALADETYEERARLRAYFAEECRIWGQIAEQIEEAEWHISGQMKELAEQISEAQSSQPADQHNLQHQQHSQLGSKWAPPLCLVCLTQEQGSQDTDLLMKQNTLNPNLFLAA